MLVKHFEPEYSKATCKDDKTKISRAIVAAVRNAKWAGRFLQKCEQEEMIWFELGDRKAWEKTSQLLREYVSMGQHRTAYQSRKYKKDGVEIMGFEAPPGSPEDGSGVNAAQTQILLDCLRSNTVSTPEPPQAPINTNTADCGRAANIIQSLQAQQQQAQQIQAQQQAQQIHTQQQVQQSNQLRQAQKKRQQEQQRHQQQQQNSNGNNSLQTSVYNVATSINNKSQHQNPQTLAGGGNNQTAVMAVASKNSTLTPPIQQAGQSLQPVIDLNHNHDSSITTPNIAKIFPVSTLPTTPGTKTSTKRPFHSTTTATNNGGAPRLNKNSKLLQNHIPTTGGEKEQGATLVYPTSIKPVKAKRTQPTPTLDSASMVTKSDLDLITVRKGSFIRSLQNEIDLWSYKPSGEVMKELTDISRRYNAQVSVYSQMTAPCNR